MCLAEWANYDQAKKEDWMNSPDSAWPEETVPGQFLNIKSFRMNISHKGRNKNIGKLGVWHLLQMMLC